MNLAITTTSTRTWKAVKRNYVTAISGVTLAAFALFGAFTLSNTNTGTNPSQSLPSSTSSVRPIVPASPAMTYYIVGSQEQLLAVQAEADARVEDNAIYAPGKNWMFSILLASTPAEAADASGIVDAAKASWRAAGASGLEVLDLRTR